MTRAQRLLLVVLVVQVALFVALRVAGGRGGSSSRGALLPELRVEQVNRLEISARDAATLVLERAAEGWGLAGFGGYPADTAKVATVLRSLADLTVGTPVVTSDRYHATLKVVEGESDRRVRVWQSGQDDPVVDLLIGSSAQSDLVYARRRGDDRVFEVEGLAPHEVRPEAAAWIEGRFFEFPVERVTGFRLTNGSGSFQARRDATEWRVVEPAGLAGRRLDPGKVDGLLRSASAVYAVEPIGPASAGALLEAVLAVELAGAAPGEAPPESRELRVGEALPGDAQQRSVTRAGFGFAAAVHENSLHRVLNERWSDLAP